MKENCRYVSLVLSAFLASVMLIACNRSAVKTVDGPLARGDMNVALFTMSASGEFWSTVMNGADAAGKDLGIKYTINGPATETSFEQQIKMTEDAITKGANAICIAVCDADALVPTLENAAAKGIKIVLFNTTSSYDGETFIATDNFIAGQMAGKVLAEVLNKKGKYACLGSAETVESNRARCDGVNDYIGKNASGMELADVRYCANDLQRGMAIVNDWITATPDIAGIFSNNDMTTTAVANVLRERGLIGKIAHVGFDATETNVVYLEEGITNAIITQDAYDIGYQSIKAAVTLLEGGTVEKNVATNVAVVTKDNLNDSDIRKILNF
jgi:ribose transport system substrate-binding protein